MEKVLQEMKGLKEQNRMAGEIGKTLLSLNESLKKEKEFYKSQLEASNSKAEKYRAQLSEFAHENQDLRSRMQILYDSLAQLERTNSELVEEVEKQKREAEVPDSQQVELNLSSDMEKENLIAEILEEKRAHDKTTSELNRVKQDNERATKRLTLLEEQTIPSLKEELKKADYYKREHENLQGHVKTLEKSNQEMAANLFAFEHLHSNSEEWKSISQALTTDEKFFDRQVLNECVDQLLRTAESTEFKRCKEDTRDMLNFLKENMGQSMRWLVCSAYWRNEAQESKAAISNQQKELAKLREEIEVIEHETPADKSVDISVRTPDVSLAVGMAADQLDMLQQKFEEAEREWNQERKQMMDMLRSKNENAITIESKQEELNCAKEELHQALTRVAELESEIENVRKNSVSKEVMEELERVKQELQCQKLLAEESRKKVSDLIMHKAALQNSLSKISRQTGLAHAEDELPRTSGDRRQSYDVRTSRTKSVSAFPSQAQSYADMSTW